MEHYIGRSSKTDRWAALITALAPRGWLVLGVLALTPYFLTANPDSAALAAGLGGVLLAQHALRRAALGAVQLAGAWISWESVAETFQAARDRAKQAATSKIGCADGPVLEAAQPSYRYSNQRRPALENCSLSIAKGDFLLLEGSSGSGKSTLVSVVGVDGAQRPVACIRAGPPDAWDAAVAQTCCRRAPIP